MKQKNIVTNTIHILTSLFTWLIIWNHLNFEFGEKVISYFFPDITTHPYLLLFQSFYLLFITSIILFLWFIIFKKFDFFYLNTKKVLLLYIIPLIIFLLSFVYTNEKTMSTILQETFSFIVLSFSQDILTFGILQTYLSKLINTYYATILTVCMFFIGHIGFFPLNILLLFYITGFVLFGYLRYKDKNIYRLNVIHTSFNLIRHFF